MYFKRSFFGIVLFYVILTFSYCGDLFYNFSFETELFFRRLPKFKVMPASMKNIQLIKNSEKYTKAFKASPTRPYYLIALTSSFLKNIFPNKLFDIHTFKKVEKIVLKYAVNESIKNGLKLHLYLWKLFKEKPEKIDYKKINDYLNNISDLNVKQWYMLLTTLAFDTISNQVMFFKEVNNLIKIDSSSAQFNFILGKILISQFYDKVELQIKAIEKFKKSLKLMHLSNDFRREIYVYLKGIVSNREIFSKLGDIFLVYYYQLGIKFEPFNPELKNNLAYIYAKYGNTFKYSKKLIDSAIYLEPNNPYFLDTRGWIYFKMGKFELSIKDFLKAYKLNKNIPDLCYHIASYYYSQGNIKEAENYFSQAYKLNPENPLILNDYGYLLCDNDLDYSLSLKLCQEAVKRKPLDNSYLDSLGWIFLKTGKIDYSIKLFKKIINQVPNSSESIFHLAVAYFNKGDLEKARMYARKSYINNPEYNKNVIFLGNLYLLEKLISTGKTIISVSEEKKRIKALNIALVGKIYEQYFNWNKAYEYYRKASSFYLNNKFILSKTYKIKEIIKNNKKMYNFDGISAVSNISINGFKFSFSCKIINNFSHFIFKLRTNRENPIYKYFSKKKFNFSHFNDYSIISNLKSKDLNSIHFRNTKINECDIFIDKKLKEMYKLNNIKRIKLNIIDMNRFSINIFTDILEPSKLISFGKRASKFFSEYEKMGYIEVFGKKILDSDDKSKVIKIDFKFIENKNSELLDKFIVKLLDNELYNILFLFESSLKNRGSYGGI